VLEPAEFRIARIVGERRAQAREHIFRRVAAFVSNGLAGMPAIEVAKYLSSLPGVAGKCWVDEFPLGLTTFEALERMLHMCVGAVFILDTAESDGRPNDNVTAWQISGFVARQSPDDPFQIS
jgi:hypothetical protein